MMDPAFSIEKAESPDDLSALRALFIAYARSLPVDLAFQSFSQELSSLPGKYAAPTGCLYLARLRTGEAIGCVAMRPLTISAEYLEGEAPGKKYCEIKRLYCVPKSRGMGLGKSLVEEVVREAERLGYEEMRLDTLPSMESAIRLYKGLGFVETRKYYNTPIEATKFLSKRLR